MQSERKENETKQDLLASIEDAVRETISENDQLRQALARLLAECCDRQGALLRPTKAALKQAILVLHPLDMASRRYPGLMS